MSFVTVNGGKTCLPLQGVRESLVRGGTALCVTQWSRMDRNDTVTVLILVVLLLIKAIILYI